MSEGDSPSLKPQVIMRGDEYALINVDLNGFNELQRLGIAILVWDQVRTLMEMNGTYKARDPHIIGTSGIGTIDDIDHVVAELANIKPTSLNRLRPRLLERPNTVQDLIEGKYASLKQVIRSVGMRTEYTFFEGGGKSKSVHDDLYFGRSDKFEAALAPMRSYFRTWRKKNFRYAHVNPKEAQKRVKLIDEVMADLAAAREDLANRSHVATYRAPSEKRRENK